MSTGQGQRSGWMRSTRSTLASRAGPGAGCCYACGSTLPAEQETVALVDAEPDGEQFDPNPEAIGALCAECLAPGPAEAAVLRGRAAEWRWVAELFDRVAASFEQRAAASGAWPALAE